MRILVILLLLGIITYYIYHLYSHTENLTNKLNLTVNKTATEIIETVEERMNDIDTKLLEIENLVNSKLDNCCKKVNDVYSMQNKVNEITKMNNQSILYQINQYDEEINDFEPNNKQTIFNSVEQPSISPQGGVDNSKYFIKHNKKTNDKEMFYMSSNKNADKKSSSLSSTSSNEKKSTDSKVNNITENTTENTTENLKEILNENNTQNNIFSNLQTKKNNLCIVKDNISLENNSNLDQFINSLPDKIADNFFKNKQSESIILEMNTDNVKPCKVEVSTPKFKNAMKILNENNIIKNNSFNKLNELKNENELSSINDTDSDNLNIDNFSKNYQYINMIELGENILFSNFPNKQNNTKIIELN